MERSLSRVRPLLLIAAVAAVGVEYPLGRAVCNSAYVSGGVAVFFLLILMAGVAGGLAAGAVWTVSRWLALFLAPLAVGAALAVNAVGALDVGCDLNL